MKNELLRQLFKNLDKPKNDIARSSLGDLVENLLERERWLKNPKMGLL